MLMANIKGFTNGFFLIGFYMMINRADFLSLQFLSLSYAKTLGNKRIW
jgi:hypothetical protein